jgi:hypothetical protein
MKVVQKIVTNIDSCVFRDKNLKFDGSSEWKLPSPTPSSRSPETTLHIVVSIPFRIPGYIFPISLFFHYDFLSRIDYELLSNIFWDKKSFPNTWTHVGCSEKSGAKCPSPKETSIFCLLVVHTFVVGAQHDITNLCVVIL